MEDGIILRNIQKLPGYEISKTTDVYTHITTKGLRLIKRPLDKLNIL
jgi:site-specific recombinase XerD